MWVKHRRAVQAEEMDWVRPQGGQTLGRLKQLFEANMAGPSEQRDEADEGLEESTVLCLEDWLLL